MSARRKPTPVASKGEVLAARFATMLTDALRFASTDSFRPIITAVQIVREPKRIVMRATDSYTAVEVVADIDEGDEWQRVIIRRDCHLIATLLKAQGKDAICTLAPTEHGLRVVAGGTSVEVEQVNLADRDFPDIVGLFDKFKPGTQTRMALDPKLVARIGMLSAAKGTHARFDFGDELKPIRFTVGDNCRGLIMPVRIH